MGEALLKGRTAVDAVPESGGHPIVLAAGPYDCVGCGDYSSVRPDFDINAHLFVSTPAIPPPGWLYAWPKFPTLIPQILVSSAAGRRLDQIDDVVGRVPCVTAPAP